MSTRFHSCAFLPAPHHYPSSFSFGVPYLPPYLPFSPQDVVVGDIALLEPGEVVPCDGIFLSGHNVKCDESGLTGESDAIKKVSYEDCLRALEEQEAGTGPGVPAHTDCFVVSGAKVLEGVGSYVVIAVGEMSFNGRIMMSAFELSFRY